MSVEDAQRRELSVSVKNASSSFMTRDKDVIGQVSPPELTSAVHEYTAKKKDLDFLTLKYICTKLFKLIRLVFREFILNYELL